jgi:hypothetical protein
MDKLPIKFAIIIVILTVIIGLGNVKIQAEEIADISQEATSAAEQIKEFKEQANEHSDMLFKIKKIIKDEVQTEFDKQAEKLKLQHMDIDKWLTILTIFLGLYGIITPYIVARHSFSNIKEKTVEIDKMYKEVTPAVEQIKKFKEQTDEY